MSLEVHYLGRLPFYGDRVRKVITRVAGPDGAEFGAVPSNRDELNAVLRAIRGRPADNQLVICPLAPSAMLAEVSPAAAALGIDILELLARFREMSGSHEVPVLCPVAGRAFSDPRAELEALHAAGIGNAMVVLAPNLIGAGDVIRDPRFRIGLADAEHALAELVAGRLRGQPAAAMIDLVRLPAERTQPATVDRRMR